MENRQHLNSKHESISLKPPFLRDTENGRNSRNWGVENGKWEVSFSEMIWLIFAQNLSNLVVLSIKCWAKSIFYLLFLQNVALLAFWGHTFAVWMPFSALHCEEMFAEGPFCLFTPGEVFLEHCKKFPRFSNFNLLIQKNGKFWSVCTVFDRKRKNTENGKSAKRNLNFIKRRNGGLILVIVISQFFKPLTTYEYIHHSCSNSVIDPVLALTHCFEILKMQF